MKKYANLLLTLAAALLLVLFAAATPWPSITEEAEESYMNESFTDDYSFLFE